jgi:CoA:oxalate CoA-transferase
MNTAFKAPLDGIRVIDFTQIIAGPFCARLLADCGAEVIKLEPVTGEHMRNAPPQRDGVSSYYGHLNAGKKSVAVNLTIPEVQEAVRKLVKESDVVVENFRPGVMKRLGFDYATLSAQNPDLVYCAISGFGQDGPRALQPAYAPVIHAGCGLEKSLMEFVDGDEAPRKSGAYFADYLAAVYGFGGIQTGLLSRFRHGGGRFIDVALMDSMINMLAIEVQAAQFPLENPRRGFGPVSAGDGYVIITPITQKNFELLAKVIERPDMMNDPRFSSPFNRTTNWNDLMAEIELWTKQRPARECEDVLMAAGIPCSQYKTVGQAIADPQIAARGVMQTVTDAAGPFQVPNPPFKFGDNTVGVSSTVSAVGEYTREVLSDLCGLSEAEIDELLAAKHVFAESS